LVFSGIGIRIGIGIRDDVVRGILTERNRRHRGRACKKSLAIQARKGQILAPMARLGSIVKNEKRKKLTKKFASKRKQLKATIQDPKTSFSEKIEAQQALNKLPKNSSKTRIRSRCKVTGRPRAVLKKFELCRNAFRQLALEGHLPGVIKSSW
jgi:small subunit ribosomal protein S14